ncbi:hypothetical protein [Caulobacter sp. RL271]|uniref:Uncharacterized protein n=1 Tax=Caulobacter segnis TaxID=88688 RepID=A0ABY4ZLX5_9CAUL|nr:hypothetical protein [Caulobacter segnis]USQ93802.1 hypothetical protein MZV50_14345 [Caulobacter segnis]
MRNDTLARGAGAQFAYREDGGNSPSQPELLKVAAERAGLDAGCKGSVLADLGAFPIVAFDVGAGGDERGLRIGYRAP